MVLILVFLYSEFSPSFPSKTIDRVQSTDSRKRGSEEARKRGSEEVCADQMIDLGLEGDCMYIRYVGVLLVLNLDIYITINLPCNSRLHLDYYFVNE